jgi:hypothetical protein
MGAELDVVDRFSELPEADFIYRSRAELETAREQLRTAQHSSYAVMKRITDVANGRPLTRVQSEDFSAAERRCERSGVLLEAVEHALAAKNLDRSQILDVTGPADGNPARMSTEEARALMVGSPDRGIVALMGSGYRCSADVPDQMARASSAKAAGSRCCGWSSMLSS